MKKAALIIYGIFYLVLLISELFHHATIGEFSALIIISSLSSCLYILGFLGYILNKKIWSAVVWRVLFNILLFIPLLFSGGQNSIEIMVSTIFNLPLIYCLYQYSKADNPMWLSAEENMKKNFINDLFIKESILFVEKTNGVRKAKVTVSKESKTYIVQIIRSTDGDEESFTKKFKNISQLMTFIEQYSMIRVSDFEEKYA